MAQIPAERLYTFLGFVAWGDLNQITIYRSERGPIVFFQKTYPDKPASPEQQYYRAIWRAAMDDWNALDQATRNQWRLAARRASLCMTGYNLWIAWKSRPDLQAIRTLERQTQTSLLP